MVKKSAERLEREIVKKVTTQDEYFLGVARLAASRSKCLRSQVGCAIADKDKLISVGYNGVPKGMKHCIELGCAVEKKQPCRGVHSEQNAINQAAFLGISTKGATLYIVGFKCFMCARSLINAGIKRVVCYMSDDKVIEYLKEAGIETVVLGR